jgi:DNA polymerase III subunit epsilon
MYLFFDVETTGLSPNSNRIVQIAWVICDRMGNTLERHAAIIRPNGFRIPPQSVRIHGITTERALREGVEIRSVMRSFALACRKTSTIVAHNADFDLGFARAELRLLGERDPTVGHNVVCTMKRSTSYCRIPSGTRSGYKWPKLAELYEHLFGKSFVGAHDAENDVEACRACFFELVKRGVVGDVSHRDTRNQNHPDIGVGPAVNAQSAMANSDKVLVSRKALVNAKSQFDKLKQIAMQVRADGEAKKKEIDELKSELQREKTAHEELKKHAQELMRRLEEMESIKEMDSSRNCARLESVREVLAEAYGWQGVVADAIKKGGVERQELNRRLAKLREKIERLGRLAGA